MLRRSYVLPWPGTLPGAAHPKTRGSMTHCTWALNFASTPGCTKAQGSVARGSQAVTLSTQCFSNADVRVSQCSLHNAPIFRLLLKVAVNGTHQCESLNFCGDLCPNHFSASVTLVFPICRARRAGGPPFRWAAWDVPILSERFDAESCTLHASPSWTRSVFVSN